MLRQPTLKTLTLDRDGIYKALTGTVEMITDAIQAKALLADADMVIKRVNYCAIPIAP